MKIKDILIIVVLLLLSPFFAFGLAMFGFMFEIDWLTFGFPIKFATWGFLGGSTNYVVFFEDSLFWFIIFVVLWRFLPKFIKKH